MKMENKIFNSFFTEIFVSQWFLKLLTKLSVKKQLNILFSIKMENKIYNSFSTKIFVSPCVYKLIIYIHIFNYLEPALHKNVLFGSGFEPTHCKHAMQSRNRLSHPILKQRSIFLVHI